MTAALPNHTPTKNPMHVQPQDDKSPSDESVELIALDEKQSEPLFQPRFVPPPDGTEWS